MSNDIPSNPDAELHMKTISLNMFSNKMESLYDDLLLASADHDKKKPDVLMDAALRDSLSRYLEFAIAGIDRHTGHRYKIELRGSHEVDSEWIVEYENDMRHRVDFDSLHGRSDGLPWKQAIDVYPLFGSGHTIDKKLHTSKCNLRHEVSRQRDLSMK
jgi:hypothetical protein